MNSFLDNEQLLQYSRQIMLPQIDVSGQQKLCDAKILVLGAGGLGCPVLMYLASCGVGNITIVDPDVVELSNLQRQIIYHSDDIGLKKAVVAQQKIKQLNPRVCVTAINDIPENDELASLIQQADVVVEGTDNFSARYRHNEYCVQMQTPLVSGAVIRFEGQVSTFDHRQPNSPCYHCLYPDGKDENINCSENGVLGPVAGMVATVMATEVVKLIAQIGELLSGRLLLFDALHMEWRSVRLRKDQNCSVCKRQN